MRRPVRPGAQRRGHGRAAARCRPRPRLPLGAGLRRHWPRPCMRCALGAHWPSARSRDERGFKQDCDCGLRAAARAKHAHSQHELQLQPHKERRPRRRPRGENNARPAHARPHAVESTAHHCLNPLKCIATTLMTRGGGERDAIATGSVIRKSIQAGSVSMVDCVKNFNKIKCIHISA